MTRDFREALRFLRANPGFASVVILTLALGIGVNATIFSMLHGVLLRPLQYADPDRLVVLWESNPRLGQDKAEVSGATYLDWRARTRSFSDIGAYRYRGFALSGAGQAERIVSVDVSPALFRVLGVPALAGRVFTSDEEQPGHERLAVLSYGAWQRRFNGDRSVIGASMLLDGRSHEIVGVMPADFQFPAGDPAVELWSPLTLNLEALPSRPHRMYKTVGRLAAGTTLEQARADMDRIASDIARDHPDSNGGWGVALVPAHEQIVGRIGRTLWVLFAAVVLVLLIACANIANLLLARSARVSRDFAVRAAFGASRWALVRRSLAESGVLALSGGAVGLLLAWWGIGALRPLIPATVPRADSIGLDSTIVAFTAIMSIGSGLLFGLVPAWRAMRPNLVDALQEGGRSTIASRRARWLSNVMVVAEVALALMLAIGAGLLLQSFVHLASIDPGFRTSRVVALHVALPDARYTGGAPKRRFFGEFLERMTAVPGFDAVGAVSALPMSPLGVQFEIPFSIDGLEVTSPSERPRARYRGVLPRYFEVMAIPLRAGRVFDRSDGRDDGPRVAIVNETLAKRYFGSASPIDRRVKMPMAGDLTIVGVVGDIKHDGLQAMAAPEVFVPYDRLALSEMQVVVLSDLSVGEVTSAARAAISGIDAALPIAKISAIEDLVSASIAQPRFNMMLIIGLALSAAGLAAVGVYGLVTYAVTRRTVEIGLRAALGADPTQTFRLVVGGALRLVMVGVVLGLIGAAALSRSLDSLLFGVRPLDPQTYLMAGLGLVVVGLAAASVPAARAARIDPVRALRQE
ncbi:MAG TPA: ABC transporter permease [Vicinamibacterales bacterium]|nr:ABC transporter permease [Vicinamibacterales bacterium]